MLHVTLLSFQDKGGEQKRKSENEKEIMHQVLSGDFVFMFQAFLAFLFLHKEQACKMMIKLSTIPIYI